MVPGDELELKGPTQPPSPGMLWLREKHSRSINMWVTDNNYRADRLICI